MSVLPGAMTSLALTVNKVELPPGTDAVTCRVPGSGPNVTVMVAKPPASVVDVALLVVPLPNLSRLLESTHVTMTGLGGTPPPTVTSTLSGLPSGELIGAD